MLALILAGTLAWPGRDSQASGSRLAVVPLPGSNDPAGSARLASGLVTDLGSFTGTAPGLFQLSSVAAGVQGSRDYIVEAISAGLRRR